ncbi:MAG: hypothetical protein ACXWT0_01870 [Methylobacter sp.]
MMNKDEYFQSLLNDDRVVMSYPKAYEYYDKDDNEDINNLDHNGNKVDFLFWLCNSFNNHVKTKKHAARARMFVSDIATSLLEEVAYIRQDFGETEPFKAFEALREDQRSDMEISEIVDYSISMWDM